MTFFLWATLPEINILYFISYYRPISILTTFSKRLRIVYNHLLDFLREMRHSMNTNLGLDLLIPHNLLLSDLSSALQNLSTMETFKYE